MIKKRELTTIGALSAMTLILGCSDSRPAAETARSVSLAQMDTAGSDQITFARRQRAFLHAVATVNLAEITTLLRQDFMIMDAAPAESLRARVPAVRFPDAWLGRSSFTAEFVGSLRDELHLPYGDQATYRLIRRRNRATVITYAPVGGPFVTHWDSASAGWRVTSLLLHVRPQPLAEMERLLKAGGWTR